ncbi:hypothetical protein GCM10027296_29550 [Chitinimonas naiadis]
MIFDHGLTPSMIANLHGHLCEPTAIYKSATHDDGSIIVLTAQIARSFPVIAAIKVDKPDSYQKANVHWLASAYPKEDQDAIARWGKQGLTLWQK